MPKCSKIKVYNLSNSKIKRLRIHSRRSVFAYISAFFNLSKKMTSSTPFDTNILHNMLYYIKGGINMEQAYLRSLQMIKILNIKNRNEYNRYKKYYLVLNIDSLKYISGKRNFNDIIKIAKEV